MKAFWLAAALGWAADPIVPLGAKFEALPVQVDFAEGPAAGPDGAIYFSDIPTGPKPGRILRFDPRTGEFSVFRKDSGKSNGLAFDAQGRLVACEGADFGRRRISRSVGDAEPRSVVDRYQGKRFNAPNDLSIDSVGRIWFSDPKYLGAEPRELDHRSVFRVDPDGSLHLAITQPQVQKPNGVEVSPDGKTLYVADTSDEPKPGADGIPRPPSQLLLAFSIGEDGGIGERRVLADFGREGGVDGMTVDAAGNIYAAWRRGEKPGVLILSPAGERLGLIETPVRPTNCCFGRGADGSTLYITTDTGFGRIRLNAKSAGGR